MSAALTSEAVFILRLWGYTPQQWAEITGAISESGEWVGDACGCSDDRCIGYHHDENDHCGCLPSLLRYYKDNPPQ